MGLFGRKKNKKAKDDQSMLSLCMVLSPDEAPVSDDMYSRQLPRRIRGLKHTVDDGEGEQGESVATFEWKDTTIMVMHLPMAVPTDEAEVAADNYLFWPDGKEAVQRHRSHYLVTAMGGDDLRTVISRLVIFVREFIQCFPAIGVYWGNGSIANSTEAFLEWGKDTSADNLPLNLIMRFQFVSGDAGLSMYMLGMEQFKLMNIEVEDSQKEPMELIEFVFNVAQYLVQSGPVIEDGNTVGGSVEEKILVRYGESMLGNGEQVYRICFE